MAIASAAGFAALRNRDFAFYLSASFLATTALAMQSVALGWQIYYLTGKPFDLGLVGLMEFLPAFCLTLVSGQIAVNGWGIFWGQARSANTRSSRNPRI